MYLEEVFGLKGKIAVVAGASRGIGQTVAVGLAQAGATVIALSRSSSQETLDLIEKTGGIARSIAVDIVDEQQVDAAFADVMSKEGSVDVVFNNAGICIHKPTLEASVEEWRQVIDVNLTGEYIVARSAGRVMIENKIKGRIINMASMSGSSVNVPQWQASYNASKAGVIHMSRSLAVEWAQHEICVNSISPGYIATPMSVDTPQELKDAWLPLIPQRRMGKPEELMPAILFLASSYGAYTTGSDIIVDGGYSAR